MPFFKCAGGASIPDSFHKSKGNAKITLNGQEMVIPFKEVNEGNDSSGKKHIIWNLDNLDVAAHFGQDDLVMPPEAAEEDRLKAMEVMLNPAISDKEAVTQIDQIGIPKADRATLIPAPKPVRVYRYWTGHESSEYWKRRESRVIEIRHKDCWWYIVADGIPVRCLLHQESVKD